MAQPICFQHVTIVGTGLLGCSLGLAMKRAGLANRVIGFGRRRETVEQARQRGAVDEVAGDLHEAASRSDLLILAAPLGQFPALFARLAAVDRPELIVTDVGSTKANVCALAREHLRYPSRFIGSHPMAGSEQQGPEAADPELFAGKPCVLTPEPDSDPEALAAVTQLWQRLGMRLLTMTADRHDAQVAVISHLPHVLAVLLVELAERHNALDVASTGFADTTRIASSDPTIRSDIYGANRDAVLAAIDELRDELATARDRIATGQATDLHPWLARIKQVRDSFHLRDST